MIGINRHTGKAIAEEAHLRQSIADLLTTPLRSRAMRPDYGSRLYDLVDAPLTPETTAQMTAAIVDALSQWEPRLELISCQPRRIADPAQGKIHLALVLRTKETEETSAVELNI